MPFGEEYSDLSIGSKVARSLRADNFTVLYAGGKGEDWHLWHMLTAEFFGKKSKCLSRQIGAVVVRDKTVLATGYNGPSRGVPECHTPARLEQILKIDPSLKGTAQEERLRLELGTRCPRQILEYKSGEGLHLCPAGHAESNAVANAAREGVRLSGADMYAWCPLPCYNCAKMIIGAGIARVFYKSGPDYDADSRWMLMNAGVSIIGITSEIIEKYRRSLRNM